LIDYFSLTIRNSFLLGCLFFKRDLNQECYNNLWTKNLSSFFLNHFDKKQKQSCTRLFTCTSRNMMCRCNSAHFCSHLSTKKTITKLFFQKYTGFFSLLRFDVRYIHYYTSTPAACQSAFALMLRQHYLFWPFHPLLWYRLTLWMNNTFLWYLCCNIW